jgi:hypothetical protein
MATKKCHRAQVQRWIVLARSTNKSVKRNASAGLKAFPGRRFENTLSRILRCAHAWPRGC